MKKELKLKEILEKLREINLKNKGNDQSYIEESKFDPFD